MADGDAARWDAKYEGRALPTVGASEALQAVASWLPGAGRALDVAGGDGAQAVWLATQGFDVTLCDVSTVALQRAQSLAAAADVSLDTAPADLETQPLPAGPWALVLCCNYVQRSMWKPVASQLAVGGVAVWLHPTVVNLERHARPSRRFLLEEGEGRTVFEAAGLRIMHASEGWVSGRHLCSLVGRRDA